MLIEMLLEHALDLEALDQERDARNQRDDLVDCV